MIPGADEMIGCGFRCGVRAIRQISIGFGEGRIVRGQSAVDLVCRDMEEAECVLLRLVQVQPIFPRALQQMKSTDYIGRDEIARTMDGAVYMGLGCEIDDGARAHAGEQFLQQRDVADVAVNEFKSLIGQIAEVLEIACISQLVEINDWCGLAREPDPDEIRADKSRTTGDEDGGRGWCGHSIQFLLESMRWRHGSTRAACY